jgi:hypothetical protein
MVTPRTFEPTENTTRFSFMYLGIAFFLFMIVIGHDLKQAAGQTTRDRKSEDCVGPLSKKSSRIKIDPVAHIEQRFSALFPTSGFQSMAEFQNAIRRNKSRLAETYNEANNLLRAEKFRIGMRLFERVRDNIGRTGFKNLYETGTSSGTTIGRAAADASYADMSLYQWRSIPRSERQKYAALYPEAGSALARANSLDLYTGPDLYIFKTSSVRDRSTLTPGDSFNRFSFWHGSVFGEIPRPQMWDQMFVPWKYRTLLAPFLVQGLAENRFGFSQDVCTSPQCYGQQLDMELLDTLGQLKSAWPSPNMDYIEVQIWGKLTLDHVEEFEYQTDPPAGEFLRQLKKRNIKITKKTK